MKLTRTSTVALMLMGLTALCILAVFPCMVLFEDYKPAAHCYTGAMVFSLVAGVLLV